MMLSRQSSAIKPLRVKIVCTIGPASADMDILTQMIDAGMNVARLNMSHGDHEIHAQNIQMIREIAQIRKQPVAILADLQGPKIRVGTMQKGNIPLVAGEELILTSEKIIGQPGRVPVQNPEVVASVKAGDRILLDDGLLELKVLNTTRSAILTQVIIGGFLEDRKGINLPDTKLVIPPMTDKDRVDVEFALQQKADWIALSFVRTAADVHKLRALIQERGPLGCTTPIISKIEKPEAVQNIVEIIEASDGIMVARGDLGIEISPEEVPMTQKKIIDLCIETDKPVITATQMLDSMIRNPRPTRAEASDVANAVLDGSDGIMLSGETATGEYPVQSVQTMAKIARKAEEAILNSMHLHPPYRPVVTAQQSIDDVVSDAVSQATVAAARSVKAAAIIAPTVSGSTAKKLARFRPSMPIIAVTPNPLIYRQLAMFWGVYPLLGQPMDTIDQLLENAVQTALQAGYINPEDVTVVTGGVVEGMSGRGVTNLMTVRRVAKTAVSRDQ